MKSTLEINLFEYRDYRKFLCDYYDYAKKNRRGFSFRLFSFKAGFASPNFLKRVMEGDRSLTPESIEKCIIALGLNKQEAEFFRYLVDYTQAGDQEKNQFLSKMVRSRKVAEISPLEKDRYEYYSSWYHPVVRELVVSNYYDGTPASLSVLIRPSLTESQVEKSIELLVRLGFIKKRGKGYCQSSSLVTTGAESLEASLMHYHQNLLKLSHDLLPQIKPAERDVSALTLGIAKGRLPIIKKKVQEFRMEILKLVADDLNPEEVVLLNIQLLPVTQKIGTNVLAKHH
ncbi:MAG: hypothetical protein A3G32_00075 [Deltaproteobacteria bacterium RIFCSPLOWO2_12_FULL_40_28]|nr:MAG: hypothetical protein A3C45_04565 [Deltaproteobacteria bacterium RIFCSPHIGHO2_02_FULL_40_28]OGQ20549.1 MAG: hypothetical protein A3E27_00840 [Deltaproteobacteria bacterium RIFCSPHIGHO2_12_FULL_40_32]OGQ41219.1 MAG: hypothetical protein A3I69_05655 [Deltaproteobacteria bacterium RIFCSPLOWO2_02_FULL_40_36]OGQ55194.1 MAG: hypothetical protein A3G32_00075 [Deltaproteobacteria bacterium RIFCSPLOWO2_12_FULL_40_28]